MKLTKHIGQVHAVSKPKAATIKKIPAPPLIAHQPLPSPQEEDVEMADDAEEMNYTFADDADERHADIFYSPLHTVHSDTPFGIHVDADVKWLELAPNCPENFKHSTKASKQYFYYCHKHSGMQYH